MTSLGVTFPSQLTSPEIVCGTYSTAKTPLLTETSGGGERLSTAPADAAKSRSALPVASPARSIISATLKAPFRPLVPAPDVIRTIEPASLIEQVEPGCVAQPSAWATGESIVSWTS